MIIIIEITVPAGTDIKRLLEKVPEKIDEVLGRPMGCVCEALEDADVIRNELGTIVGTIKVEKEPEK